MKARQLTCQGASPPPHQDQCAKNPHPLSAPPPPPPSLSPSPSTSPSPFSFSHVCVSRYWST